MSKGKVKTAFEFRADLFISVSLCLCASVAMISCW